MGHIVITESFHRCTIIALPTATNARGWFAQFCRSRKQASCVRFRTPKQLMLLIRQRVMIGQYFWPEDYGHFYMRLEFRTPAAFPRVSLDTI
jgi:hypothetical protein